MREIFKKADGQLFRCACVAGILTLVVAAPGICEPATPQYDEPAQSAEHLSPLYKTAVDGDVAKLQQLLDAGLPVDGDRSGAQRRATPLMYAARSGRLDSLKLLIKAGAHLDQRDPFGRTAIWHAVVPDNSECVTELLASGADPNIASDSGQTPLIMAVRSKYPRCLTALLSKRPNFNALDTTGCSALMDAAQNGFFGDVLALVKAGADIDFENTDEETALIKAGQRGHLEVVRYLTSAGARKTKVFLNESLQRDANLTPSQRWALAITATLAQPAGLSHESLGLVTSLNDFGSKQAWIQIVQRDYGIKNRDDLLKMLDHLATASSESRELFAWHLCEFIWVVRAGYTAGYLDAGESWQKIMPVARRIQRDFNSWEELGKDLLVVKGLHLKNDPALNESYQFIYKLLIAKDDPNSPWNINPWNTQLGETAK